MRILPRYLLAAAIALAACQGTERGAPPAVGDASPPATPAAPATAPTPADAAAPPPAATASADPGSRMPPLTGFATLHLRQEQGGPSLIRCKGIAYELEVDLKTQRWAAGWCKSDDAEGALEPKRGTLDAAGRAAIEQAYGALVSHPARGCGNDGGTLTLTLRRADGSTETWVDDNWRCTKPPPRVAHPLRDFSLALLNASYVRP